MIFGAHWIGAAAGAAAHNHIQSCTAGSRACCCMRQVFLGVEIAALLRRVPQFFSSDDSSMPMVPMK
jgi:hypothetical protein